MECQHKLKAYGHNLGVIVVFRGQISFIHKNHKKLGGQTYCPSQGKLGLKQGKVRQSKAKQDKESIICCLL